jgi:hypothetical protein
MAEWRQLAMVNFEISPDLLQPLFPLEPNSISGTAKPSSASSASYFSKLA